MAIDFCGQGFDPGIEPLFRFVEVVLGGQIFEVDGQSFAENARFGLGLLVRHASRFQRVSELQRIEGDCGHDDSHMLQFWTMDDLVAL